MKTFVSPLALLLLICVARAVYGLFRDRRRRFNLALLVIAIFVWFLSAPAIAHRLAAYLTPDAERNTVGARRRIVVVLAGGSYLAIDGREYLSEPTTTRTVRGAETFRRVNADVLVVSGRGRKGDPSGQTRLMEELAVTLGIPADQVIVEARSRNTFEHPTALLRAQLASPRDALYVVTDAIHLRRALNEFRRSFPVVEGVAAAAPGRVRMQPMALVPQADSLDLSTSVLREWIGMAWYATRHRLQQSR